MKVILLENIKGVGNKDDIIDVKRGYAENFLFKNNKAIEATKVNLNKLQAKQDKKEKQIETNKANAEKIAEKIKNIDLELEANAGEDDKLFGTITNKDVAEALEKQAKVKVDKKKITIKEPIKTLGAYKVNVELYKGVNADIRVIVKGAK